LFNLNKRRIKPVVSPTVAYQYMRKGQLFGVKLLEQCIPSKDSLNREERTRLLASMRLGARLDGMVNKSKLLINVVRRVELKMLISSAQKGSDLEVCLPFILRERYVTGG